MAYGKISETFWHDEKIRQLTEKARYFMLYLMSCPHGNRIGLFVLAPGYAAYDLTTRFDEWTADDVDAALTELRDASRILWDKDRRIVFVRHYLRHNTLVNGSVVKGALNDLASVPDTPLLGDILDTVIEEQKGPEGPIRAHYKELADALRARVGSRKLRHHAVVNGDIMQNGSNIEEIHNAPHHAPHDAVVNADTPRARARAALPSLTVPNPTSSSLSSPAVSGTGSASKSEEREDDLNKPSANDLERARAAIVQIHGGTDEPVVIEGYSVGVGIEMNRFRNLCAAGQDPPDVIADAIAHLPTVTGLELPISLARWEAEDGPAIYGQCVGLVYKGIAPTISAAVARMPQPERYGTKVVDTEKRKAELKEQLEQLRGGAA